MQSITPESKGTAALAKIVREEFALAEKKIKRLDRLPIGLFVPPINELRYCAFHLLRAQAPKNQEENPIDELEKAKNHCHRAIHDCIEMEFIYNLNKIDVFCDDYKDTTITDVFPEYVQMMQLAEKAREYVINRSKNSISDDENNLREPIDGPCEPYEKYNEISNKLTGYVDQLPIIREDLNKKLNSARRRTIFGIVSVAVATVSAVFAVLVFWSC